MRQTITARQTGRLALALIAALAVPPVALADPFAAALADARAGRHGQAAAGFHALAQAGDGEAAYNLALLFMTGQGVPQNQPEAAYWAWQARLAGVPQAEGILARLSDQLDAESRQGLAARLEAELTPRAMAGDGAAMLSLAVVLLHLRPMPDAAKAHAWQSIAAALDVPGAVAARDAGVRAMDDAQRRAAEAEAMAAFQAWCQDKGLAGDLDGEMAAPPACTVLRP